MMKGVTAIEYEMIYASPYPPFGEVVDYTEKCGWNNYTYRGWSMADYNSDLAFRNTVVVQPFEDRNFQVSFQFYRTN